MPTFDFAIKRLNKKLVSFRKNTEHSMSLEDEAINPNTSTTGEDLIIDENTVDEPEHPLSCSCTQTHSIFDIQNPAIKMTHKIQTIKMRQIIKLYL